MPTLWIDTIIDEDVPSVGQNRVSLMTGVSSVQTRFDRMTLTRTIVGIDIAYTVHDSGEGSQQMSLGIGVASQEAFAAGTLPDPNSATDFPTRGWVWRAMYRVYGFAADQPAVFNARVDKDVKAQRKLENGEAYIVINNDPIEGVAGVVRVIGLIRQLWLVG